MSDIRSLALSRAYELVEAGKPDEARTVLEPILVNDRDNADAWWIYAHAVSDPNEARHALSNVLRINPNYAGAAELKAALDQQYPLSTAEVAAARTAAFQDVEPDFVGDEPLFGDEDESAARGERRRSWLPVAIVAGIIVLLFVILILVLPGLSGVSTPTPTSAPIAGAFTPTPELVVVPTLEVTEELVTQDLTPVAPEETEVELPLIATIGGPTATSEEELATAQIVASEEATEEAAASPTSTRPPARTATREASPVALAATEDVTEEAGTPIAQVASPRASRTPSGQTEEAETEAPTATRTPRPTVQPTEAEATSAVETVELPTKPAQTSAPVDVTEAVATEAATTRPSTAPAETEAAMPTEEQTAAPADDYAVQIAEDLQAFAVADQAFEEFESSLGAALVARVCTVEGLELRTTLREVMDALADEAELLPETFSALGVRLINCDADRTLRIIVVDLENATAYAAGALTQTEYEAQWRAE